MSYFLGIDTSNYTTSVSLYNSDDNTMLFRKKLLPVKYGECGLRQSDAVFHHVQQLPEIISQLLECFDGKIEAIGVSSRPRDVEGSYMPCFTVGMSCAEILSSVLKVPLYKFSHQCGHIASALYSAGKIELFKEKFLAFHVSGGTTEAILVSPDKEKIIKTEIAAHTLDLNAGQLIDRVGVMLGLSFPCGRELERLALENDERLNVKVSLKGADCCLSGIENICRKAYSSGRTKEYISALCLKYVEKTIEEMCLKLLEKNRGLTVVFSGGVMSNSIIKNNFEKKFGAYFAKPEFSADNASGTAFLCYYKHKIDNRI